MKKYKVLLVEDDVELATLTAEFLLQFEFDCKVLHTAQGAVATAGEFQPDLVLLDVMLPDGDGLDICRQLKPVYDGKIVMLTARTDTIDQVLGLELGADDYIAKPVEPRLLLAKCRAVLRRDETREAPAATAAPEVIRFADTEVNVRRREVHRAGQRVELTTPEYDLLMLLIDNRGEIVSRDQISKQLRGVEYDGQSRQIDIHISAIRHKLADSKSSPELIKTVRSKGYMFVA